MCGWLALSCLDGLQSRWKSLFRRLPSPCCRPIPMDEAHTTAAIQQYLVDLGQASGHSSAEPVVRAVLARAVDRLRMLCATLLHRSYPRLARAPVNLETDELLSAVVERLLKALEKARPANVRQFFALASQHMRWELNDLARRLDEKGH